MLFSPNFFSQYIVKPKVSLSKIDNASIVVPQKITETPTSSVTKVIKSVLPEKSVTEQIIADEVEDFDEKELDDLEASIAKAKATLGIKNVSTTSSKSIPSKTEKS